MLRDCRTPKTARINSVATKCNSICCLYRTLTHSLPTQKQSSQFWWFCRVQISLLFEKATRYHFVMHQRSSTMWYDVITIFHLISVKSTFWFQVFGDSILFFFPPKSPVLSQQGYVLKNWLHRWIQLFPFLCNIESDRRQNDFCVIGMNAVQLK